MKSQCYYGSLNLIPKIWSNNVSPTYLEFVDMRYKIEGKRMDENTIDEFFTI